MGRLRSKPSFTGLLQSKPESCAAERSTLSAEAVTITNLLLRSKPSFTGLLKSKPESCASECSTPSVETVAVTNILLGRLTRSRSRLSSSQIIATKAESKLDKLYSNEVLSPKTISFPSPKDGRRQQAGTHKEVHQHDVKQSPLASDKLQASSCLTSEPVETAGLVTAEVLGKGAALLNIGLPHEPSVSSHTRTASLSCSTVNNENIHQTPTTQENNKHEHVLQEATVGTCHTTAVGPAVGMSRKRSAENVKSLQGPAHEKRLCPTLVLHLEDDQQLLGGSHVIERDPDIEVGSWRDFAVEAAGVSCMQHLDSNSDLAQEEESVSDSGKVLAVPLPQVVVDGLIVNGDLESNSDSPLHDRSCKQPVGAGVQADLHLEVQSRGSKQGNSSNKKVVRASTVRESVEKLKEACCQYRNIVEPIEGVIGNLMNIEESASWVNEWEMMDTDAHDAGGQIPEGSRGVRDCQREHVSLQDESAAAWADVGALLVETDQVMGGIGGEYDWACKLSTQANRIPAEKAPSMEVEMPRLCTLSPSVVLTSGDTEGYLKDVQTRRKLSTAFTANSSLGQETGTEAAKLKGCEMAGGQYPSTFTSDAQRRQPPLDQVVSSPTNDQQGFPGNLRNCSCQGTCNCNPAAQHEACDEPEEESREHRRLEDNAASLHVHPSDGFGSPLSSPVRSAQAEDDSVLTPQPLDSKTEKHGPKTCAGSNPSPIFLQTSTTLAVTDCDPSYSSPPTKSKSPPPSCKSPAKPVCLFPRLRIQTLSGDDSTLDDATPPPKLSLSLPRSPSPGSSPRAHSLTLSSPGSRPAGLKQGSSVRSWRGSPLKSILKAEPEACSGPCSCKECSSLRPRVEKSVEHSQKLVKLAEETTAAILEELKAMRSLVETHVLGTPTSDSASVTSSPLPQQVVNKVSSAVSRAYKREELARHCLAKLARDSNQFCRLAEPKAKKVVFADDAGRDLCHIKLFS